MAASPVHVPTHGTEDGLFPIGHALALERGIPGARLIRLDEMGHELPREVWDVVVSGIVRHTASG